MAAHSVSLTRTIRASYASLREWLRRDWVRRALYVVAWAVMLAAFGYLIRTFTALQIDRLFKRLTTRDWLLTTLAAVVYGVALLSLAKAWLARAAPTRNIPLAQGLSIYGPALIAKYLPGSIFQYASRQVLGAKRGLTQIDMAKSSITEIILHLIASMGVALTLLVLKTPVALALLFIAGLGLGRLAKPPILRAAGFQLAFFAAFAGIVMTLAVLVLDVQEPARLAAEFMLAWLAGFLVPVAPGGLGVREASLMALAVPAESAAIVAVFAVLMRVVTVAGDALFGLSAYVVPEFTRENRQASL